MGVLVVLGCGAAGAVVGPVLDQLGARVPPPGRARRSGGAVPMEATATDGQQHGAADDLSDAERAEDGEPDRSRPSEATLQERLGVAAVTAVLFGAAADRIGAVPALAAYCVLFAGLVVVSVSDIRVGLVPRRFVYPTLGLVAVALVAASGVSGTWHPLLDAAIGGVAAFAVFCVIWFVVPRSMGFGDVRLAGLIGGALGWFGLREMYLGFLVAFVTGSVVGVVKMAVQRTGRKTALPFGPALAVGAVVGVLWGESLVRIWLRAL